MPWRSPFRGCRSPLLRGLTFMARFGRGHRYLVGGMRGWLLLMLLASIAIRGLISSIRCLFRPVPLRNFGPGFRLLIRISLCLRFFIVIIPKLSLAFHLPILLIRKIGCFNFIILVYNTPNEFHQIVYILLHYYIFSL
jgi:hypothetical protein